VDMAKAFTEYYKTKEASDKMKANKDKTLGEINERYASFKSLLADTQKKIKDAQDPILSADSRGKAQSEAREAEKEVRRMEQEINEFQQRRQGQLRQEEVQLQRGLYEEIATVVKDTAKAEGFDFVFDKTGVSMSTVPVLLYYKNAEEMTDKVIVQMNKNAPAAGATTVKPAGDAKAK
jgi:outer membrane protein